MVYLMMEPDMDFAMALFAIVCLSGFSQAQPQAQSQDITVGNSPSGMQGFKYMAKESSCFVWICRFLDEKGMELKVTNETKPSLDIVNEFCVYNNVLTWSNCSLNCDGFFFNATTNETNVYLKVVNCKHRRWCLVGILNYSVADKIYINSRIQFCKVRDFHKHSVRLKDLCISQFSTNEARNSYPNKIFNLCFNDSVRVLKSNFDQRTVRSFISQNFRLNDSTCFTSFSFLERMSRLSFLLKRKCRFIDDSSKSNIFRARRRKRDSGAGKEEPQSQQKYSTLRQIEETPSSPTTMKSERTGVMWRPKFNATAYRLFLEKQQLKQTLRMESEWAYLCLVFVSVLMLFSIWCLRGFHSRNTDKKLVTHSDRDHFLTVKEVLYQKARYLPMFNPQGPLEEVFVHDCGTNTDSSRLDMIH